jgi:hypothetical protein
MSKRKVHLIPVSRIHSVPNDPDRNKLARYRRALRRGVEFPPVDVIENWGGYHVIDGSHRFNAYRLENRFLIPAYLDCERRPSPAALEEFPRSYAREFKA